MAQNVFLGEGGAGSIVRTNVETLADYTDSAGSFAGVPDAGVARGEDGDPQVLDHLEAPNVRWRTKPYTPESETGKCYFRRIYLAVRHNAGFVFTVRPYVDGVVLLQKDGVTKQDVQVQEDAPTGEGTNISYVEIAIAGVGTALQWLLQTGQDSESNTVGGEFTIEGAAIGYFKIRGALLDAPEEG
jgi:hypothetical protein